MGLLFYISSELPESSIPTEYQVYDDGIKGNWLAVYCNFGRNHSDSAICNVDVYLTKYFPTWDKVSAFSAQKFPDSPTIWKKEEHDQLEQALKFYNNCNATANVVVGYST